ncbi:hypothetical protein SFRURICE_000740, partial [Spodoptera frugiperda]
MSPEFRNSNIVQLSDNSPDQQLTATNTQVEHFERNVEIDELFSQTLQHYSETHPTDRCYIPKQKTSKKLAKIVHYINQVILPDYVISDIEFSQLQTILYVAAWTAAKANGSKISLSSAQNRNNPQRDYKPKWQKRLAEIKKQVSEQLLQETDTNQHLSTHSYIPEYSDENIHTQPIISNTHIDIHTNN